MYEFQTRAISLGVLVCSLGLAAAPEAFAADPVGMRIVRDPVTGQLRAPTADEAKVMDEQEAQARAAATVPGSPGVTAMPAPMKSIQSNGVRYRVGDTFLSYSVVKRNADGTMDMQCVTGKETAEKLISDPKASMPAATSTAKKEHDHAHE